MRCSAFCVLVMASHAAFAQSPAEGEDETSPIDPDVIPAEELVRELRAQAEADRAAAGNDANRSAPDNPCTPEQDCTTIAELRAAIEVGAPNAKREASDEASGERGGESTEGVAPDQ
jgi:hypothetical protein